MSKESRHNQYANPRRNITNTETQFELQDRRARAMGLTWAEWVRQRTHVGPAPKNTATKKVNTK